MASIEGGKLVPHKDIIKKLYANLTAKIALGRTEGKP